MHTPGTGAELLARLERLVRDIAIRGGNSHWTWRMIDEVMGAGFCKAANDADLRKLLGDDEP